VADAVFFGGAQLGEGFTAGWMKKQRIVSESCRAARFRQNFADALAGRFDRFAGGQHGNRDTHELRPAVGMRGHFAQQPGIVGGVVGAETGIARAMHAGTSAESFDAQTGIIRNGR